MDWSSSDQYRGVQNLGSSIFSQSGSLGAGNGATFHAGIVKAFSTGGVAELSFLTNFRQLTYPESRGNSPFEPVYNTRIGIGFEQPLWRDWGVEINQLLGRFPSTLGQGGISSNAQFAFGQHQNAVSAFVDRQSEGILISRLRFDQQRGGIRTPRHQPHGQRRGGVLEPLQQVRRTLHLRGKPAHHARGMAEQLQQAQGGRKEPGFAGYYQVLGQYQEFRGERLRALNDVLDAERQLRGILGLPVEDGTRLVPITPPTVAELKPDWQSSLEDALDLRPEIQIARDNVRYHQYLLSIQKNNMKPDLKGFVRAEPLGQGSSLTGNGTFTDGNGATQPTNAFRSLANSHLMDWQIGVNLNIPLGYHAEMAAVRSARLQLTQAFLLLRDQEDKTARILANNFAELSHWYERIKVHRMRAPGLPRRLEGTHRDVQARQRDHRRSAVPRSATSLCRGPRQGVRRHCPVQQHAGASGMVEGNDPAV